jgi:hypothetical protein
MIKLFESYNKEKEIREWLGKNDGEYFNFAGDYTITSEGIINVVTGYGSGDVDISRCELTEIPYQFGEVSGRFLCYDNNLTSLKGSPYKVGENFNCSYNQLVNLKHAPIYVGIDFDCYNNEIKSITDFVGLSSVGGAISSDFKDFDIFGSELLTNVIVPNYEIFEDMDIIYEENGIKYYQPNALRAFVRQEAPSYLSKINLKEIEIKFKELGLKVV